MVYSSNMYYIGDALRDKLNAILDFFAPDSLAHYDEVIVDLLQSESLLDEMEVLCLELVEEMKKDFE